jgi:hypothetical protein
LGYLVIGFFSILFLFVLQDSDDDRYTKDDGYVARYRGDVVEEGGEEDDFGSLDEIEPADMVSNQNV